MSQLPPVYGFNKTSEMGPELFAPSIFLGGCNMRCPYCMNSQSVFKSVPEVDVNVIKDHVEEFKPKWLMISGGEPTLTKTQLMINLFKEIRSWGVEKIGMSTNGTRSAELFVLATHLNYVAMDIKTASSSIYQKYSTGAFDKREIKACQHILITNKATREDFDFEYRTTLYPDFVKKDDIEKLAVVVGSQHRWVLQPFRKTNFMLDKEAEIVEEYTEEEVQEILEIAKNSGTKAEIRYV